MLRSLPNLWTSDFGLSLFISSSNPLFRFTILGLQLFLWIKILLLLSLIIWGILVLALPINSGIVSSISLVWLWTSLCVCVCVTTHSGWGTGAWAYVFECQIQWQLYPMQGICLRKKEWKLYLTNQTIALRVWFMTQLKTAGEKSDKK